MSNHFRMGVPPLSSSPSADHRAAGPARCRALTDPGLVWIMSPGSAAEKPNTGVIVAVGTGRLQDNGEVRPLAVKEGDKVVFGPYSGNNTIKIDGEDLLIMSESEIYGVLEG